MRFRCHHCERSRDARLAILAARFGPNTMIEELLPIFIRRCPWDPYSALHKPWTCGHRCGARSGLTQAGPGGGIPRIVTLDVIRTVFAPLERRSGLQIYIEQRSGEA